MPKSIEFLFRVMAITVTLYQMGGDQLTEWNGELPGDRVLQLNDSESRCMTELLKLIHTH